MININAMTQPATIPPTPLPLSSFCSRVALIEGVLELVIILMEFVLRIRLVMLAVELMLAEPAMTVEPALVVISMVVVVIATIWVSDETDTSAEVAILSVVLVILSLGAI